VKTILASPHKLIQCENCHGPAIGHPDDNTSLKITGSRELCLRCHTRLAYPQSDRGKLLAVAPDTHNSGENCVECHKPHNPDLEKM
jgi:predicted CXXCH cytochrome family protein